VKRGGSWNNNGNNCRSANRNNNNPSNTNNNIGFRLASSSRRLTARGGSQALPKANDTFAGLRTRAPCTGDDPAVRCSTTHTPNASLAAVLFQAWPGQTAWAGRGW